MSVLIIGGPPPAPLTEEQLAEARESLSRVKIQLMAKPDSAFFTTLVFSMRYIFDERVPTACTNGKWIRISPHFWNTLDNEERIFLVLHEALHVAYLHMLRLMGRCADKWNQACDYVINAQLIARGFKMPSCGLYDRKYEGMSAEEVYEQIPPEEGGGFWKDLEPVEGTEEEINGIRREIEDALVRAQIQSKMGGDKPGTIPGEIEIFLNKLLNPKLPWQRIVQKYLQSYSKNDYTFRKPNRRYYPEHILPSLWSESLIDLAMAIDVSGSIGHEDFLRFVSETHSLLKMMKPKKLTLIQFDTELKSVDEIESVMDLMRVKFTGGGGTDIGPVLEWSMLERPQLLIVFTDGEFHFRPEYTTRSDVLWIVHDDPDWTAPYGKVVHYEMTH